MVKAPTAITRAGPSAIKAYESQAATAARYRAQVRESTSTAALIMDGSAISAGAFSAGLLDATVLPRVGQLPGSTVLGSIGIIAGLKVGGSSGRSMVLAGSGMMAPVLYSYGVQSAASLTTAIDQAKASLA